MRGSVGRCPRLLFAGCWSFFKREFENESGQIRRGIYMVFEGFPLSYKHFIFSIKKKTH